MWLAPRYKNILVRQQQLRDIEKIQLWWDLIKEKIKDIEDTYDKNNLMTRGQTVQIVPFKN